MSTEQQHGMTTAEAVAEFVKPQCVARRCRFVELPRMRNFVGRARKFISALHSDTQAPAVVEMILAMADTMGLETVAEGVETPSQSDFLRRRGCTLAQGYLYAKPIPPDDFMKFLSEWKPLNETMIDENLLASLGGAA